MSRSLSAALRVVLLLSALPWVGFVPADEKKPASLKVMEFRVSKPASPEEKAVGLTSRPGTTLALLLDLPGRQLIGVGEGSKVASLTDDKGTNLIKDPRSGDPFYEIQWMANKPGPRGLVYLVAPVTPARGATRLTVKGTLAVRVGSQEKEAQARGIALKADGNKIPVGPVNLVVPKDQFIEGELAVEVVSDKVVKNVAFLDAAGKELKSSRRDQAFGTDYLLRSKPDKVTIKVTYFDKTETVVVPINLSFGVGL
jgi:hypothetical protein